MFVALPLFAYTTSPLDPATAPAGSTSRPARKAGKAAIQGSREDSFLPSGTWRLYNSSFRRRRHRTRRFGSSIMAKKILIGVALFVVLFVIGFCLVVGLQPSGFSVERSASVAAPPAAVFALVDDLRAWDAWSPWSKLDPN